MRPTHGGQLDTPTMYWDRDYLLCLQLWSAPATTRVVVACFSNSLCLINLIWVCCIRARKLLHDNQREPELFCRLWGTFHFHDDCSNIPALSSFINILPEVWKNHTVLNIHGWSDFSCFLLTTKECHWMVKLNPIKWFITRQLLMYWWIRLDKSIMLIFLWKFKLQENPIICRWSA